VDFASFQPFFVVEVANQGKDFRVGLSQEGIDEMTSDKAGAAR